MEHLEEDQAAVVAMAHYGCRTFAMAKATESAVDCLRRVLTEPSSAHPFLEPLMPEYDLIREEPVFVELLAEFEGA